MADIQTEGLTFEKVWASIRESDRRMKEADRKFEKKQEALTKQIMELSRQMGLLHNRFGELAEHMVAPSITEKFREKGFKFIRLFNKGLTIEDPKYMKAIAEIDILLESYEVAIAIEVKAKASYKDVDKHVKRMALLRRWTAEMYRQRSLLGTLYKKKLLGGIAGAIMSDEVRTYAQKAGFYTIVQSGDTVKIDVPDDFVPKDW
ncbi:MAG: hypothetical protein FWG29_09850 [Treponema sp.]|nr:hypothetical protein [Treponema sp.]